MLGTRNTVPPVCRMRRVKAMGNVDDGKYQHNAFLTRCVRAVGEWYVHVDAEEVR
jgi:hypothetical protein